MYRDIAAKLINGIQDGQFEIKLPTEAQLMEMYHASRNTIRKAIDLVYQQGLLRRVQGSGYFITSIQLQHKTVVNLSARGLFSDNMHPRQLVSKVLTFDTIKSDYDLSKQMGVPQDSELYRVIRLRYWHEQLYCLEKAYYLKSVVPYLSTEAVNTSIWDFLNEAYGLGVANSDDYLSLTNLSEEDASLMQLGHGDTYLALDSCNYYKNNGLLDFSHTVFVYPDLALYFHTTNLANN
ncbi:GntR family transcriptional regulator [Lactiplantibacillus fabifermentans]|uniref:Transcription regulator n=2 Tax=Lactiplantibacillus fabifermentans TaxID=483011 RepID=A0A0R2NST3_9LACO|nr:GntR family transcriptional regulator [Lactiplantibacillus fabifermentans]ETY73451.1 GntR family transcriptional regulator [Lactiplantibacillus fabifermentans T30PCM01]KRO27085.1 transcription regulator [Lactiplantibacillus fabifermentans DSM 21115]